MKLTTMRDYSEKRDFIRMKIDADIILEPAGSANKIPGKCKDLSGTGMLVEVGESVPVGAELQTSLPSNNPAFPSFDTVVKVLRCEELPTGRYLLGMEIVQVRN